MSFFRRLGLAVVVVAALAVWPASGAMAGSRQVPLGVRERLRADGRLRRRARAM